MKSGVFFWPVLLAVIPAVGHGEDPLFWPNAVDTIEVVAPRPFPEEKRLASRGFVQVVPLGSSAPVSADLGDLLDRAVGVQVRRYGGLGAVTLASVRGSSPSQVQVMIDETPISTAPDALANLSLLPVRLFEHVEIARGPLATSGGTAAAGVVRLVTPDEFDLPPRLRFGVGSFGTTSISATAGGRKGRLSLLVAGGRLASEGDYPYLDRRGTPWNTDDDETVRRQNNAFHQEDLLTRARWSVSRNVQIETTGHGLWKDSGVPGTESIQTEQVHDRFRRWLQSLSLRARNLATFEGKLTAHLQEDIDRYQNLDGEIGLGRADFRNRLRARGIKADIGRRLPWLGTSVRVTGRLVEEMWKPANLLADAPDPRRDRLSKNLGAELSTSPLPGRIDLFAGQEWLITEEMLEGSDKDLQRALRTPRLGVSIDVAPGLRLRAGWGEFTRLPSFVELFGHGGIQQGNPKLTPEKGEGWDIGAIVQWPRDAAVNSRLRSLLEFAYFETRTRDAIIWLQNSQRTTLAQNLERTRVEGSEILFRVLYGQIGSRPAWGDPALGFTAAVTYLDARDDGPSQTYNGKVLPHQPGAGVSLETRIDLGPLRVAYLVDYESELFRDRYNSAENRRGPRMLHDVEVTVPILATRLGVTLAVRNLTDRQTQDVDGFPVPGRSAFVQLTASTVDGDAARSHPQ